MTEIKDSDLLIFEQLYCKGSSFCQETSFLDEFATQIITIVQDFSAQGVGSLKFWLLSSPKTALAVPLAVLPGSAPVGPSRAPVGPSCAPVGPQQSPSCAQVLLSSSASKIPAVSTVLGSLHMEEDSASDFETVDSLMEFDETNSEQACMVEEGEFLPDTVALTPSKRRRNKTGFPPFRETKTTTYGCLWLTST